jgi:hypothetical protein
MRVLDGDGLLRVLRTHEQLSSVARVVCGREHTTVVSVYETAALVSSLRSSDGEDDGFFDVLLDLPSKKFPKIERALTVRKQGRALGLVYSDEEPELVFVPAVFDPYGVLAAWPEIAQFPFSFSLASGELTRTLSSLSGAATSLGIRLQAPSQGLSFMARGELSSMDIEFSSLRTDPHDQKDSESEVSSSFSYSLAQLRAVAKDLLAQAERVVLAVSAEGLLKIRGAQSTPHLLQVCCLLPEVP